MADCFLDTNVLLYAVSTNPAEATKAAKARELVQSANWACSAQVAAEFLRAGTAARQTQPLTRGQARQWIETWMAFPMAAVDGALVLAAVEIGERFQLSQFDAQILAAAQRMGCATVYSEDLNHGQDYGGVRVLNPFLPVSAS
ncbi:MAG: PIN domain-containing protein [Chthoniobacter sp.]|uniref:PIN domain-containing protein n=1 Tax=Chthoniobacter sp. TaxID=2510640 RepID=UPI0032A17802